MSWVVPGRGATPPAMGAWRAPVGAPACRGTSTVASGQRRRTVATTSATAGDDVRATRTSTRSTPARRAPPSTMSARARPSSTTSAAPSACHSVAPMPSGCSGREPPPARTGATAATTAPASRTLPPTRNTSAAAGRRPMPAHRTTASSAAPASRQRRWVARRSPSGHRTADAATASSHQSIARVGRWSTAAGTPPTTPATSPPVSPHTISGPAAGAAAMFAGSEASGTVPNVATRRGDTAAWAATVTDSGVANQRGPGSSASIRLAPATMPAAPATDSRKPSDVARRGSISSMAVTPRVNVRTDEAGRPAAAPTAATDAMAVARRTDGSARVTSANIASTPSVTTRRGPKRSLVSRGANTTITNATFCPDTASRCVSPAALKASSRSAGWARSSPSVMPARRLRWRSGSPSAPRASVRRRSLASRVTGPPVRHPVTVSIVMRPAM